MPDKNQLAQGVYRMEYDGRPFVAIIFEPEELEFLASYIVEKLEDEVDPYRSLFLGDIECKPTAETVQQTRSKQDN